MTTHPLHHRIRLDDHDVSRLTPVLWLSVGALVAIVGAVLNAIGVPIG